MRFVISNEFYKTFCIFVLIDPNCERIEMSTSVWIRIGLDTVCIDSFFVFIEFTC